MNDDGDVWDFDASEALLDGLDSRDKFAEFLRVFSGELKRSENCNYLILYDVMDHLAFEVELHGPPDGQASWRYIADRLIGAAVKTS